MIEEKIKKLKKWFFEKEFVIKKHLKKRTKVTCRMGDIYFAKVGINVGWEIDKHRPVLVFQNYDRYFKRGDLVFVFPITSKIKKDKFRVCFSKKDIVKGMLKDGDIIVSQGRTMSKVRLVKKMGSLKNDTLFKVAEKFEKFLYKNTPLDCSRGTHRRFYLKK